MALLPPIWTPGVDVLDTFAGEKTKTSQELQILSSVTINCQKFRFSIDGILNSVSNVKKLYKLS